MKFKKIIRLWLATLLSAWVLLLSLARVSPELHNWFHLNEENTCAGHCHSTFPHNDTDAPEQADHVCPVTLFASGVDYGTPFSFPDATFLATGDVLDFEVQTPFVASRFSIHARAPPVAG